MIKRDLGEIQGLFLSAKEAATLFDIGLTRIQSMMRSPDANYVMSKGNRKKARIHRKMFEEWLMVHEIIEDS